MTHQLNQAKPKPNRPIDLSLPGSNDGIKTDADGNIWASGRGGVVILSPEGKQLGEQQQSAVTAGKPRGQTPAYCSQHTA